MYLFDGFSTLLNITFQSSNVLLYLVEREVTPPSLEVGSIDITTMRSGYLRHTAAKQLVTVGNLKVMAMYDPAVYGQLLTIVTDTYGAGRPPPSRVRNTRLRMGQTGLMQVLFPDASTLSFWGFIDKITPSTHKEGEFPSMELDIVPTNRTFGPEDSTLPRVVPFDYVPIWAPAAA